MIQEYDTEETVRMPAIRRVSVKKTDTLKKAGFTFDTYSRPYYCIFNREGETIFLIKDAVEEYGRIARAMHMLDCYPSTIVLSAFRYLSEGMYIDHYYPAPGVPSIPITWEGPADFDVMVRGNVPACVIAEPAQRQVTGELVRKEILE